MLNILLFIFIFFVLPYPPPPVWRRIPYVLAGFFSGCFGDAHQLGPVIGRVIEHIFFYRAINWFIM